MELKSGCFQNGNSSVVGQPKPSEWREMGFKTKEDFTEEDSGKLRELGFITHTGSPYYEFDEFYSFILNPCHCSSKAVICVLNEDEPQDEYIYPLFEIHEMTLKLLELGLIESEEISCN